MTISINILKKALLFSTSMMLAFPFIPSVYAAGEDDDFPSFLHKRSWDDLDLSNDQPSPSKKIKEDEAEEANFDLFQESEGFLSAFDAESSFSSYFANDFINAGASEIDKLFYASLFAQEESEERSSELNSSWQSQDSQNSLDFLNDQDYIDNLLSYFNDSKSLYRATEGASRNDLIFYALLINEEENKALALLTHNIIDPMTMGSLLVEEGEEEERGPAAVAAHMGCLEILKKMPPATFAEERNEEALALAVQSDEVDVVLHLAEHYPTLLKAQDTVEGMSAVAWAAQEEKLYFVHHLDTLDPTARYVKEGYKRDAFSIGVYHGSIYSVKYLGYKDSTLAMMTNNDDRTPLEDLLFKADEKIWQNKELELSQLIRTLGLFAPSVVFKQSDRGNTVFENAMAEYPINNNPEALENEMLDQEDEEINFNKQVRETLLSIKQLVPFLPSPNPQELEEINRRAKLDTPEGDEFIPISLPANELQITADTDFNIDLSLLKKGLKYHQVSQAFVAQKIEHLNTILIETANIHTIKLIKDIIETYKDSCPKLTTLLLTKHMTKIDPVNTSNHLDFYKNLKMVLTSTEPSYLKTILSSDDKLWKTIPGHLRLFTESAEKFLEMIL